MAFRSVGRENKVCELGRGDGKWKDLERLHDPDSFSILPIIFQHLRADLPNPQLSSAVCSLLGRVDGDTVFGLVSNFEANSVGDSTERPFARRIPRKTPPDP